MQYEDITIDPARAIKFKIAGKKFAKSFKVNEDLFIFVENVQLSSDSPRPNTFNTHSVQSIE